MPYIYFTAHNCKMQCVLGIAYDVSCIFQCEFTIFYCIQSHFSKSKDIDLNITLVKVLYLSKSPSKVMFLMC